MPTKLVQFRVDFIQCFACAFTPYPGVLGKDAGGPAGMQAHTLFVSLEDHCITFGNA
jgi:hypothetical protein